MSQIANKLQKALNHYQRGELGQSNQILESLYIQPKLRGFDLLRLYGIVRIQLGQLSEGTALLKEALSIAKNAQQSIGVASNLATALLMQGDHRSAFALLEQALNLDEGQTTAYHRSLYCDLLAKSAQWERLNDFAQPLQSWRGFELQGINYGLESAISRQDREEAERLCGLLQSSDIVFEHKQIAPLISMLISLQKTDVAEHCLGRYVKQSPNQIVVDICKGVIGNYHKDSEIVRTCITDEAISVAQKNELFDVLQLHKIRAQSFERMGKFDEAFADYSELANIQNQRYRHHQFKNIIPDYRNLNLDAIIENASRAKGHENSPIFMIGFPRSGTTLLENILGTQKEITELSEIGTLEYVSKRMTAEFGVELPRDLERLSSEQIECARELYFDRVESVYPGFNRSSLIIDKMPAYTIAIPFILTLFPKAKFIFSIRHPLDCCMSSFQQLFKMDQEMSFLVTLEGSLDRYSEMMSLFEHYEEHIDLNIHFIKYEDLITTLDEEVVKLGQFLNLDFDASYRNFSEHSKTKVVATPSASQVSRGLYMSSKEKWRNYEKHIQPFAHKVEKYVAKWGYSI